MLCPDEKTRLAFLISECDKKSVSIIFSTDHKDAQHLSHLRKGMHLHAIMGPLGKSIVAQEYGNVCIVCDNEGVGPGLFIANALKQFENRIIFVAGFDEENEKYYADRIEAIANKAVIAVKKKGDAVDALVNNFHELIRRKHMNLVISICDIPRMAQVAKLTELRTKNLSLLTPLIYDGVGMCGTCRIMVGDEQKLACQDGPALDGDKINWDSALHKYKAAGRSR